MLRHALVTGGAGFIGSHVSRELLRLGASVTILDDLSGGFEDNIPSNARFIKGSVTDDKLVDKIFSEGNFDYVYHFAAYAAEGLSHFIRRFNYQNNVIGSVNLINAAVRHEVKCFVFTSSIAVYGAGQNPMKESLTPEPEDPYGIAKLSVEYDLRAANRMFGLDYVIFRPHNVYGEFQNIGDRYRNVVGIFLNQVMQGQPMTVFGDGEQKRAFSYVGDIAEQIASAPEIPGALNEVFNIGADEPFTVNELAGLISQLFDVEHTVVHLPPRNEVVEAYADHEKLYHIFGRPRATSLREGITRMVEWAKRTGPRQSRGFKETELTKNLPDSWAPSNVAR